MASEVTFAGNGESDISMTQASTDPGNMAGGGESVIDFAGKGALDVDHANTTGNQGTSVSDSGPVEFAGNV